MSDSPPPQLNPDASVRPAASRWTPAYLRVWRNLIVAAGLALLLCICISPLPLADWKGVGMLVALAVVASLLPLNMPEASITASPVVPIVFASAGLFGATAAVLTIMCCSVVECALALRFSHSRENLLRRTSQFIACGVLEVGAPSFLYAGLHHLFFPHGGVRQGDTPSVWAWLVLSFCTMLTVVINVLLATTLASRYFQKRWDLIWHDNMRWMLPTALLMSPVPFVAGVLYRESWMLGIAFIVIPTWATRMAIIYHDRTLAAYKQGVELLGRIMQESHPYTHGHLHRVSHWAKKIAEELHLSAESMQFIEDAAVLHDIGKVAVDDRVLNKVGKLSDEDWAMIRRHPVVGADIVGQIRYFNKVSHWIRHHHERPDGRGYPNSMTTEEIPVEACIISVVDAYDAMVGGPAKEDKRPYREPMMPEAAVAELRRHAGSQFHEEVVEAFVNILEREQQLEAVGEIVQREPEYDSLWDAPLTTKAAAGTTVSVLEPKAGIV